MNHRQLVINKMNEDLDADIKPFVWTTIPLTLRRFWLSYFKEKRLIQK